MTERGVVSTNEAQLTARLGRDTGLEKAVAEKRKWSQAQTWIPLQEKVSESAFGEDDVCEVVKQHTWRWVGGAVCEKGNID